jgi:hypothetical protein
MSAAARRLEPMRGDPCVAGILDAVAASCYPEVDRLTANALGSGLSLEDWIDQKFTLQQSKLMPANEGLRLDAELALRVRNHNPREPRYFGEEYFDVDTRKYSDIDADAAWILAEHREDFLLDGLTDLSPEVAEAIGSYEGGCLSLCGLRSLSAGVAAALSGNKSRLILDGLKELSVEAAKALARHKGALQLNGLTDLSVGAAKALARHKGSLQLNGLTTVSIEAAEALVRSSRKDLCLNGLTKVSIEVATALAGCTGFLLLSGLTDISVDAADVLLRNRRIRIPVRFGIRRL